MAAAGAAQGAEVRAAAEFLPDLVRVGADVEAFAAYDAEIDLRELDAGDFTIVNAHEARFALHDLALAGEFVEGDAIDLHGADHRRDLVKIAAELVEGGLDVRAGEVRHGLLLEDFALGILRVRGGSERECAGVFLVLAHEEVLNARGIADDEDEHAGGHRVQRAAVADFFGVEAAARHGHHVMRGHFLAFIDQENAINRVVGGLHLRVRKGNGLRLLKWGL